jgi:DnaJ-class molecular chaperone
MSKKHKCANCDGTGFVWLEQTINGIPVGTDDICPECRGDGVKTDDK